MGTVLPAWILYGAMECPLRFLMGLTVQRNKQLEIRYSGTTVKSPLNRHRIPAATIFKDLHSPGSLITFDSTWPLQWGSNFIQSSLKTSIPKINFLRMRTTEEDYDYDVKM